MTNQPHQPYGQNQPYEGHDGWQQGQQGQSEYDAQAWPAHQQPQAQQAYQGGQGYEGYEDPNAGQYTQQWQGQTWGTQVQPPVSAEETAYLPPQTPNGYQEPAGTPYGTTGPYAPQQHPQPYPAQPQPQAYPSQPQPYAAQPQPHPQPHPQPYEPTAPAAPAPLPPSLSPPPPRPPLPLLRRARLRPLDPRREHAGHRRAARPRRRAFADHRPGDAAGRAHGAARAAAGGRRGARYVRPARPARRPPGRHRGGLVPPERHVARPAGHRAGLRGRARRRRGAAGVGPLSGGDPRHARGVGAAVPRTATAFARRPRRADVRPDRDRRRRRPWRSSRADSSPPTRTR